MSCTPPDVSVLNQGECGGRTQRFPDEEKPVLCRAFGQVGRNPADVGLELRLLRLLAQRIELAIAADPIAARGSTKGSSPTRLLSGRSSLPEDADSPAVFQVGVPESKRKVVVLDHRVANEQR